MATSTSRGEFGCREGHSQLHQPQGERVSHNPKGAKSRLKRIYLLHDPLLGVHLDSAMLMEGYMRLVCLP